MTRAATTREVVVGVAATTAEFAAATCDGEVEKHPYTKHSLNTFISIVHHIFFT